MGSTKERRKSTRNPKPASKTQRNENGAIISENEATELFKKEEEISVQLSHKPSSYGWQHPAELDYFTPSDWSDTQIIHHCIANAFDIPGKPVKNGQPFCEIVGIDGSKTVLPAGYRIPLMFLARFQWHSLKLVLTAENRQAEWEEYKFGILHVSRMCKRLFEAAQDALGVFDVEKIPVTRTSGRGVDRRWRCPTVDRALTRYRLKWFLSKPEILQDFWSQYGELEYNGDIISFGWRSWALKGYQGFCLTNEEMNDGLSAQQLMSGLKLKDGIWFWDIEEAPITGGTDAISLRHTALAAASNLETPSPPPPEQRALPLSAAQSTNLAPATPRVSFAVPHATRSVTGPKKVLLTEKPVVNSISTTLSVKRPGSPLENPSSSKRQASDSHPSIQIKREPSLDLDIESVSSAPSRFKRRTSTKNVESETTPPPNSSSNTIAPPTATTVNGKTVNDNGSDEVHAAPKPPEGVRIIAHGTTPKPPGSSAIHLASRPKPLDIPSLSATTPAVTKPPLMEPVLSQPISLPKAAAATIATSKHPTPNPTPPTSQPNGIRLPERPSSVKPSSSTTHLITNVPTSSTPLPPTALPPLHVSSSLPKSFVLPSPPSTTPISSTSVPTSTASKPPPHAPPPSTSAFPTTPPNTNLKLVDNLFLILAEEMKKFTAEIHKVKAAGVTEIRELFRQHIRESPEFKDEVAKAVNDGPIMREIQSELAKMRELEKEFDEIRRTFDGQAMDVDVQLLTPPETSLLANPNPHPLAHLLGTVDETGHPVGGPSAQRESGSSSLRELYVSPVEQKFRIPL